MASHASRVGRFLVVVCALATAGRSAGTAASPAAAPPQACPLGLTAARRLLPQAHRVGRALDGNATYVWLSASRVLRLWYRNNYSSAVQIDAATGRASEITGFSRAFARATVSRVAGDIALSPNRRWLLWQELELASPSIYWDALSLDGRRHVRDALGEVVLPPVVGWWAPDSLHWLMVGCAAAGPLAERYSISDPCHRDVLLVPAPPGYAKGALVQTGALTSAGDLMVITGVRAGKAGILKVPLATCDRFREPAARDLGGWLRIWAHRSSRAPGHLPPQRIVDLPPGTMYWEPAVSPDRHRIAWGLCVRRPPRGADRGEITAQVWVSDQDARHMREIGYEPVNVDDDAWNEPIGELAWLPDSRRVSFTFKRSTSSPATLYVVRVAK